MCGRGRLFPDTEQPPQNAPHAAGRTPHHDLHALTSCHASTPRRRRSAETPPETSGTPPETRRRSGCPVPAPARRSPETSFRRHIVARYIPPLLQYMKERTRRAWRAARAARRCFLSFRVCRGERLCPPVPCHSEPVRTLVWESVSPCLPLRGRCQREALTEGELPRVFLSPSRLRRQPPPRGGLTARRCRADGTSGRRPLQVYSKNNAAPRKGRRAFSVHVWHRRRRVIFAAFTSGNRVVNSYLETTVYQVSPLV